MATYTRKQVASLRIDNKDYPVYEGINTIGRNKDAVVNIKNLNISQNHAILVIIENKHYLSDIGSSNLTYHNGVKLIPFLTCQLSNESKIKFGNVNAVYYISDVSSERLNHSRLEMTQDMTQGFYNAETQIFQDITNLEATQKIDLNVDVHDAPTQVMSLSDFKVPEKPAPRKSDTQSQSVDIHDAATQLFDMTSEASTSKSQLSEEDELTQPLSLNTTEKIAQITAQSSNVHDECTQVVDLKEHSDTDTGNSDPSTQSLSFETRSKIAKMAAKSQQNIWDQATQVANLRGENSQTQDLQYSEVPNLDIHENYMDDSMEIQNNISNNILGADIHLATQKRDLSKKTDSEKLQENDTNTTSEQDVDDLVTQKIDFSKMTDCAEAQEEEFQEVLSSREGKNLHINYDEQIKQKDKEDNLTTPKNDLFKMTKCDKYRNKEEIQTARPFEEKGDVLDSTMKRVVSVKVLEIKETQQHSEIGSLKKDTLALKAKEDSDLNDTNHQDLITDSQTTNNSKSPELDDDATDCEDNLDVPVKNRDLKAHDESSNDSLDFFAMDKETDDRIKKKDSSFKVIELEPLYDETVNDQNNVLNNDILNKQNFIGKCPKILEDSESETDDEIIKPKKRKSVKLLETQENSSDSETESAIGTLTKKRAKRIKSDSDTDYSDIEIKRNTPAKPLKSTQVSQEEKQVLGDESYIIDDADSYNERSNVYSEKKISLGDTTIPGTQMSFNNSDCIPATQEVRGVMESKKKDSVESDKTESFNLVLSLTEKSEKFHDSQTPGCSKDVEKNVEKEDLYEDNIKINQLEDDDLYFAQTQKVNVLKSYEKPITLDKMSCESPEDVYSGKTLESRKTKGFCPKNIIKDSELLDDVKNNVEEQTLLKENIEISQPEDDDLYFAPTQKLNVTEIVKTYESSKLTAKTRSKSPEDDDLYFERAKISKVKECNQENNKKHSQEKPVSQKSESMDTLFLSENTQKLNSQISSAEHNTTETDFYYAATQKLTEQIEKSMDETNNSLYIQVTQKLPENENKPTSVLEKMDETDDGFYLQATQPISKNKQTGDVFSEATQDLYDQDTQKLPSKEEVSENIHLDEKRSKSESLSNSGKKFAFKKAVLNLDASLNTCLKPNSPKSSDINIQKEMQPLFNTEEKAEEPDFQQVNTSQETQKVPSKYHENIILWDTEGKLEESDPLKLKNTTEDETQKACSLEIPLATQLEMFPGETTRPTDPISTILEEQPTNDLKLNRRHSSSSTSPILKSKTRDLNTSINNLDDLKGFSKVLFDKQPCMTSEVVDNVKMSDLSLVEKLESQNQKTVEKLLKSDEENHMKKNDLNEKTSNKKLMKAVPKRTSKRRLPNSSNKSKTSGRNESSDGEQDKNSERLTCIEESPLSTRRKITRSRKINTKLEEDESSDNKEIEKKTSKLATKRTTRRRASTVSEKSKTSETSDTSEGEDVTNKRKESIEEFPITSRRPGRQRKPSASTEKSEEETTDKKMMPQPKVTKRISTRKKILSDEEINSALLLNPVADNVDESSINKTINLTLNTTSNQTMNSTMNQTLALLEAKKTTTRKVSKKASDSELDLQLKAPANRRSMNLVCEKEESSDIKTHVKLAKINETLEKKTGGRGKRATVRTGALKDEDKVEIKSTTSNKRKKVEEKADEKSKTTISSNSRNVVEKIAEPTITSRGRKTAAKRPAALSSSISDSGSVSGDSVLSTPKKQRLQRNDSALLNTAERNLRRQKPKVVFTMLESPQLESLIRQLGGSIVQAVSACTVLVTEHVKRSQKLLAAIGEAKPICAPSWITESKKSNEFLDPWDHILTDQEAETKWQFSLRESLKRSSARKILQDYTFQIMTTTATDVLKGAIDACGGKCVSRFASNNAPNLYIIASPENKSKYQRIVKQNPEVKVIQPEAIFDGILRQELRFERHYLT